MDPKAADDASKVAVKTIFDYQKELGLSDKQVTDIKALMGDLQKTLTDKTKDLTALRQDLADMLKKKSA